MLDLRNQKRQQPSGRAEQVQKIYADSGESKQEFQNINRPQKKNYSSLSGIIAIIFILAVGAFLVYQFAFKPKPEASKTPIADLETAWYSVKLIDGEIFYGRLADPSADPLKMDTVYYNYDQAKSEDKAVDEAGSLRLVKRGKETHGPTGEMHLSWDQILYLEPLGEDSKVLKAIREYEK